MPQVTLKTLFTLAIASLLPLTSAFALDTITKKSDGKKISGSISAMTKNDLTLKVTKGEETIPSNDIALIEWEGGGPELKMGYTEENGGRFELATQRFTKAKDTAKTPSDFLKGEFEYALARVAAKQALEDPDKRQAAIQKLQAVEKAYPDHVRYYDSVLLLSQVQLAAKDFAGARNTVEALKKSPYSDVNLAGRITEARVLMDEGKTVEAISSFEAAASSAGNSSADQARKYEAMLGQARGLISQTKYDDAVKILEEVTTKAARDTDSVQAEGYTLLGQAMQGLGRTKDAILAYLHVDLIFPREGSYHAEALYQLTQLWKADQHPDRAEDSSAKLVQLYPHSEWRKKLVGKE